MPTTTLFVDPHRVLPFLALLKNLSVHFEASYQTTARVEITITTESASLAATLATLAGASTPPAVSTETVPVPAAAIPITARVAVELPMVVPAPDPHRGLVACNVAEKSATCPHCGHAYIRRRKDQTNCLAPECRKAAVLEARLRNRERQATGLPETAVSPV